MRAAILDVETTGLEAVGPGMLLCVCVRPTTTGRTRTFRLDDYKFKDDPEFGKFERQEKALLSAALEELAKYDLLVGWNLDGFDLGFLRSRAQALGVPFTLCPFTYDGMLGFRRTRLRTTLNFKGKPTAAMDMVADFFGLEQLKTKIYPCEWWKSIWGNEAIRTATLDEIVDHCRRDVAMNHRIYEVMLPMDNRAVIRRWM